ncbi:ABC transporter ATP-binding protein [Solwaraspora sp. WMMD791]|uniref:ABC transporter ATP-binding protein n=1 Tax=Solwaraspora sp. WMMD791 TaxID=3016086 RepID=UPI00249A985D|nr:ABC transporter ATP-binding protein [Solwaraspora sp. WMMD791]WFE30319.1 ABC transporter ATP-binding protein [Solwaraspora sp. WMMD791]
MNTSGHPTNPPPERQLRLLRDMATRHPLAITVIGALALLATAGTLALPWAVGQLIANLGQGETARWTTLMIAFGLGSALANTLATFLLSRLGQQMICRLRVRTMGHVLRLPLADVRREGSGNLVSRITADTSRIKKLIDVGPIQLPIAGLTVVGTLVIMGLLDWRLLVVTVGAFLVAAALIVLVVKRLRRSYVAVQESTGTLAQRFAAAVDAVKVIKTYRAERSVTTDLAENATTVARREIDAARMEALMTPVVNLGQQIALVAVVSTGGARLVAGGLSLADFVSFLLYLLQLTGPFMMVAAGVTALRMGAVARDRFTGLFAMPTEESAAPTGLPATVTDGSAAPADKLATPADKLATPIGSLAAPPTAAVRFDRVRFGYGADPVLCDVSFTVPLRGLTAMVGLSGAGKTTAVELIQRFADVDRGSIEVLGRDVRHWSLAELRGRIAYVDQAASSVQDTIRRNLTLGRADNAFSDGELMTVLQQVGLAEEVRRLPDGLDTVLAGDVDLSGGQRQRLAIARAMLTDAPVVLLDEPSSHLDSVNEGKLRDLVDELAATRAVLVVAHRISTIRHADHVVVLEAGEVVGQGGHDELLRDCATYTNLVHGQMLATGAHR